MAKLKANGTKYPDKFYQTRDVAGELENFGDTAGKCLKNVFLDSGDPDNEEVEMAEYTLTSVKKYKLKYEAEEAN